MKIDFNYVDFGAPVFSQGKNFGNKVESKKHNAKLWFDTDTRLMYMQYKGYLTVFDGFFSGDVIDAKQAGVNIVPFPEEAKEVKSENIKLNGKNKFQVSATTQGE